MPLNQIAGIGDVVLCEFPDLVLSGEVQRHAIARTLLSKRGMIADRIILRDVHFVKTIEESFYSVMSATTLVERALDRITENDQLKLLLEKIELLAHKIPGKSGQVLRFFHFDKLSYSEIAERMGITERTAFRQMKKAMRAFIKIMERKPYDINITNWNALIKTHKWLGIEYARVLMGKDDEDSTPSASHDECEGEEAEEINQTHDEGRDICECRCA